VKIVNISVCVRPDKHSLHSVYNLSEWVISSSVDYVLCAKRMTH
jgi:hypothetical protein